MTNFNEGRYILSLINSRFKNGKTERVIVTKNEWELVKGFLFSKERQGSILFLIKISFFSFFSLRSFKTTKKALERVERKFTSLNSVDVERSTITLEEWKLICSHSL